MAIPDTLLGDPLRLEDLRRFLALSPNLFCLARRDGSLLSANLAWSTGLGFEAEGIQTLSLPGLSHAADRAAFETWWESVVNPGETPLPREHESRIVGPGGAVHHVQWRALMDHEQQVVHVHGRDVSERRRTEAALRESEQRFRTIADAAPILIWLADTDLRFHYFNRPWLEFTGKTLDEVSGERWLSLIHPEDTKGFRECLDDHFGARRSFRYEYRLLRYDGEWRWIMENGTPRYDEAGRFAGFIGSAVDIQDQNDAEMRLAVRALKQATLATFSRFALAQHPFQDLLLEGARTVRRTLRVDRTAVLRIDPDRAALVAVAGDGFDRASLGWVKGTCSPRVAGRQSILLAPENEDFPCADVFRAMGLTSGLCASIGAGKRIYGFIVAMSSEPDRAFTNDARDFLIGMANVLDTVHQRELAESALEESNRKLRESQKMEAVGILAGGVAHDFNNLLTAIRCYGDMLNDEVREAAPSMQPKIAEILRVTARASALTRQLLAFSRRQVIQPEVFDLGGAVREMHELIRSMVPEVIQLDVSIDASPSTVNIDRAQLEQVIMNLTINARDAMAQGGRLVIAVEQRTLRAGEEHELAAGRYVQLSVTDTGSGIPEDVQSRVFEPFFTTKPKGRGTGLGLATCALIVRDAQGGIFFTTSQGLGTTFRVLLPFTEQPEAGLALSFEEEADAGGREHILLVEDDELIRSVASQILENLGYRVTARPDGLTALEFAQTSGETIDLLLSDIVMPHMGGRELAERVRQTLPAIRVLLMSGYIDDPDTQRAVLDEKMPFLEKPFTRDALAKRVRRVLDA
jgi:two-component system, cell cycle sensor histidine kinase and response regulator CckA